jgi:hypothetical protein
VQGGGVLDSAAISGDSDPFPEAVGLIVHGINGSIVVLALALLLLVISFFLRCRSRPLAAGKATSTPFRFRGLAHNAGRLVHPR